MGEEGFEPSILTNLFEDQIESWIRTKIRRCKEFIFAESYQARLPSRYKIRKINFLKIYFK